MIENLRLHGFRCFNRLEIDHLSDINLIAGKNNSGKTSLLEAVFLLGGAGNARMASDPHVVRDLELGTISESGWNVWDQLFSRLDTRSAIEIAGTHSNYGNLELQISSSWQPQTEVPLDRTEIDYSDDCTLTFTYFDNSDVGTDSHIHIKGDKFEIEQPTHGSKFPSIILLPRLRRSLHDDASRLATLRRQKQSDILLSAMKAVEPRLESIEVIYSNGSPMIWGDIGLSELVPLPSMGEGMTRIASLVLAIGTTPNGLVLVDEIENGFHHSVLADVWRAVDEAAGLFHVQVFATTHSLECVESAHESLSADRFSLHRLEFLDGISRCVTYEHESIDAAVRHGLDVR